MTRRALATLLAAAVVVAVAGAVSLASFFAAFVVLHNVHADARGFRVILATLLLVVPVAAGGSALVISLATLEGRWGAHPVATAALALVAAGVALAGLFWLITTVNSCEFRVSLPYPGVRACRE